jgi:hypothetical protein
MYLDVCNIRIKVGNNNLEVEESLLERWGVPKIFGGSGITV